MNMDSQFFLNIRIEDRREHDIMDDIMCFCRFQLNNVLT